MKYAQRFRRKRWGEAEILQLLKDAVNAAGGQAAFARQAGCNRQFVCNIISGREPLSDRILDALGLRRVVTYERVEGGE